MAIATVAIVIVDYPRVTAAQKPTDAQIASIVVTANQVDIDAGKLAEEKATDAAVKDFARVMVGDHTAVNKSASDLASKLKITPEDNPTSTSLKSDGDKHLEALRNLQGAAFDKAYIDREVAYHQQVIDAVDKTLIPNAQNDELKTLLTKTRPTFVAHLNYAKQVQSKLEK
jgi:putative membrane protein